MITLEQLTVFFLIFARIAGLVQLAPVFNNREVFGVAKVMLIFWVSSLLIFVVPLPMSLPDSPIIFGLAITSEFLVGALLGFAAQLLVVGIEAAGSLMDTQAGLSAASLLDPGSGRSVTILSNLLNKIALITFLTINGHHMLLAAVFQSYKLLPIGAPVQFPMATEMLMHLGTNIFAIALQFAAPILFVVFLIDFCFGMLSKIAPQLNVFQLGFQVKPIISIFILLAIVPGLVDGIYALLEQVAGILLKLLLVMQTHG